MSFSSILIAGGAGFVGSQLACRLKQAGARREIIALDNLKRRGSELALRRLRAAGVQFLHADVRCTDDLHDLPDFDLLVDCAAEPSVAAGQRLPAKVIDVNFIGTLNCLEAARQRSAAFLLLSTSRVYPIQALNSLPYRETDARFEWTAAAEEPPGFSTAGIGEAFSLAGPRSIYGTSKLAAEMLVQEYVYNYGMQALINRCGVLAGPWQMGKTDQGFIVHWVASHYFGKPLQYRGYNGSGKQVRDVLHVADLVELVEAQLAAPGAWGGRVYNVSGGNACSVSLLELTRMCQSITGRRVDVSGVAEETSADVRIFIGDSRKACEDFLWRPVRTPAETVSDICQWIEAHHEELHPILGA